MTKISNDVKQRQTNHETNITVYNNRLNSADLRVERVEKETNAINIHLDT